MENRNLKKENNQGFVERSGIFSYTQKVQRLNQLHRRAPTLCQSISQHVSKQISGSLAHEDSFCRDLYAETNDYSLSCNRKGWKKHSLKEAVYMPDTHPIKWIAKSQYQTVTDGSRKAEKVPSIENTQQKEKSSKLNVDKYTDRLNEIIRIVEEREKPVIGRESVQMRHTNRDTSSKLAVNLLDNSSEIEEIWNQRKSMITNPTRRKKAGDVTNDGKSSFLQDDKNFQLDDFRRNEMPLSNMASGVVEIQNTTSSRPNSSDGSCIKFQTPFQIKSDSTYSAAFVTGIMDHRQKYDQDWETNMHVLARNAAYSDISKHSRLKLDSQDANILPKEASFVINTKQNTVHIDGQHKSILPGSKTKVSAYKNNMLETTFMPIVEKAPKSRDPMHRTDQDTCTVKDCILDKSFEQESFQKMKVTDTHSSFSNRLSSSCVAVGHSGATACNSAIPAYTDVNSDKRISDCYEHYAIDNTKQTIYRKEIGGEIGKIDYLTDSLYVDLNDSETHNGRKKSSKKVRFAINTYKIIDPVDNELTASGLSSQIKSKKNLSSALSNIKEKFKEDILRKNPLFGLGKTINSAEIKNKAQLYKQSISKSSNCREHDKKRSVSSLLKSNLKQINLACTLSSDLLKNELTVKKSSAHAMNSTTNRCMLNKKEAGLLSENSATKSVGEFTKLCTKKGFALKQLTSDAFGDRQTTKQRLSKQDIFSEEKLFKKHVPSLKFTTVSDLIEKSLNVFFHGKTKSASLVN